MPPRCGGQVACAAGCPLVPKLEFGNQSKSTHLGPKLRFGNPLPMGLVPKPEFGNQATRLWEPGLLAPAVYAGVRA